MAAQVGDPMQVPWHKCGVRSRGKGTRTLLVLDQKTDRKMYCLNRRPAPEDSSVLRAAPVLLTLSILTEFHRL